MTTAFKNWHSLAVGAVLLAFSVFLTSTAFVSLKTAQTALQGWAMLIIAGYAFVSAIFLGASPLSENNTLTESFPGVFDHFKSFIVADHSTPSAAFSCPSKQPTSEHQNKC